MSRHMTPGEEGFLQRLHRRKQAARNGEPLPEEPPQTPAAAPGAEETPPLTDKDMPPIDSLDAESDYSGFLSPGVSEALQQAALRRLWRVTDLDFIDDLDIYASDYTRHEPLGDLVTQEMRHRLELEARRQAEAALQDEPPQAEPAELASAEDPVHPEEESDT